MDELDAALVEKALPSCAECRRRKAKCDQGQPCNNCHRFGRECSYEKVARSPLTRKHLTRVEKELAAARTLIRQLESHRGSAANAAAHRDAVVTSASGGTMLAEDVDVLTDMPGSYTSSSISQTASQIRRATGMRNGGTAARVLPRNNAQQARSPSPTFALENLPTQGDFDWDERVPASSQSHFIDGMASLPESSRRGYMGVTSGAALLRLANDTPEAPVDATHPQVDENEHNVPSISYAMYSLSQLEPFVDAYFRTYHISYPLIHEATFRAQFMEVIPRPKSKAWQVLLHIVSTLGSFAASETAPEIDLALFEATKSRITIDMLETGNIILVQAFMLISNYVQKRNKPNSGYNYLGLAKRMAMSTGLHKEVPQWHSEPLKLEIRRRAYWCLYVLDVGAIITFSRPLDLSRDGIEIQLPLNVSDGDITSTTRRFPQEVQETTLYTHVRCQSQFHLATSGIYTKLISTPFPTAKEMIQADDTCLETWVQSIPSYYHEIAPQAPRYKLSHSILQWRWRNFRILMYRPYLMRKFLTMRRQATRLPASDEKAIQRCLSAAAESIQLITNYWNCETQNVLACWYSLYFLFQATLIPVICLRNEPHSAFAAGWREQVLSALKTISSMTGLNSAASRCYNVVTELCGVYITDLSEVISPTSESPLTQLNALNFVMQPMIDPNIPYGYDFSFLDSMTGDFINEFAP